MYPKIKIWICLQKVFFIFMTFNIYFGLTWFSTEAFPKSALFGMVIIFTMNFLSYHRDKIKKQWVIRFGLYVVTFFIFLTNGILEGDKVYGFYYLMVYLILSSWLLDIVILVNQKGNFKQPSM